MVNHKSFSNTKHSVICFNIPSEPCVSTELSRSLRSCSSDKDQVLDKLSGRYSPTVPAGDDDGNVVVGIIVHTTWVGSLFKLQRTADVPDINRDEHRTVVRFLANIHQVR